MKQTSIIAFLLTLLSLLLVMSAALVFLFQGRQELRRESVRLRAEISDQNRTISQIQSTAAAREMALVTSQAQAATNEALAARNEARAATSEARAATSEARAATSEALLSTRETELTESQRALEQLAATREAELLEPPLVSIIRPLPDTVVSEDATLEIFVVAGHPEGIDQLRIVVGDRPVTFQDNGEAYRIFDYRATLLSPGPLMISATITSTNQLTASDVVNLRVSGEEPADGDGDTQGFLAPPSVAIRIR